MRSLPLDRNGSFLTGLNFTMNEQKDAGLSPEFLAAERLAEVDLLSRDIRKLLEQMIAAFKADEDVALKDVLTKLNQLHAAHLQVVTAEERFHAKLGSDPDEDAIDYDAVRFDVGCRLNRLRQSLLADGFPCDADTRAACNAALSVRLLGDAASD
ncbi:hypothetical protein MWU60_01395 [Yoonia sp. F2084L]|uniref:hypothetical protein n=1 Tax=Yoonia sp. F2084L TaxID=2926419 RepID=UPI001FF68384|nr:hypothetical protein [Yoonia sp. F2084L]MCK0094209.1 hypothetical protein [Yoonia sp. F2084L]